MGEARGGHGLRTVVLPSYTLGAIWRAGEARKEKGNPTGVKDYQHFSQGGELSYVHKSDTPCRAAGKAGAHKALTVDITTPPREELLLPTPRSI